MPAAAPRLFDPEGRWRTEEADKAAARRAAMQLPIAATEDELIERWRFRLDPVLDPVIPAHGLTMLYARRGLGKTWTGMQMARAVAAGTEFLGWTAPRPRHVLYVDGEMPAELLAERAEAIRAAGPPIPVDRASLRFVSRQAQSGDRLQPLDSAEGVDQLHRLAAQEPTELLVLDSLGTLSRGGGSGGDWTRIQDALLELRRSMSVLVLHHANKRGEQRGDSRHEDALDVVVALRRPSDWGTSEGGLRTDLRIEKIRRSPSVKARWIETRLSMREGLPHWSWAPLDERELERAAALFAEGCSIREAARELGVSPTTAARLKKRAVKEGRTGP